jgi:hypothetical protein
MAMFISQIRTGRMGERFARNRQTKTKRDRAKAKARRLMQKMSRRRNRR